MENGDETVQATSRALAEIVGGIGKVSVMADQIAVANRSQVEKISEMNKGLSQVEQVTQNNSASAEQTASATEELASQAEHLNRLVARFTIRDNGPGASKALVAGFPALVYDRTHKKIGVIFSGLHFHHHLFTRPEYREDVELVYIRHLSTVDLLKYNVLVVPRESNQEALMNARNRIAQFLNQGRTLVSFGETVLPWLPGLVWENRRPRVCYAPGTEADWTRGNVVTDNLKIESPDHPLFEGLTLEDMCWHYHGIFHPLTGQQTLLSDGQDGAVILFDKKNFPGRVMATTLDPEEHAGFGEVTITEKFLARCMAWVRAESLRLQHDRKVGENDESDH